MAATAALTKSQATETIANLRSDRSELRAKLATQASEFSSKMSQLVREQIPQVAIYGGAGAGLGILVGYFLHDRFKGWFGADSYAGLLATAALGAALIVATPSVFKVTRKSVEKSAGNQAAMYGFGIGMLGVGAYRAYQEWPAA